VGEAARSCISACEMRPFRVIPPTVVVDNSYVGNIEMESSPRPRAVHDFSRLASGGMGDLYIFARIHGRQDAAER